MKILSTIAALLSMTAIPAFAETRSADSHVHGTGMLMIAVEGAHVSIALEAPGADIAGFEHAAESSEDRAKIAAAETLLSDPLALFALPAAAGCAVESVTAGLAGGHEDHDHDDHEDHGQEDHDGHEAHNHAEQDDQDSHDHGQVSAHSEFHAEYALHCARPEALTGIRFGYFDAFPNAEKLNVQIIGSAGASAFDVHRDEPVLKTGGIN